MAKDRLSCEELVQLVREAWAAKGLDERGDRDPAKFEADRLKAAERALAKFKYLDEYVDMTGAAEFIGLEVSAIRTYTGRGIRRRKAGEVGWAWPEADLVIARRKAWKLRTVVIARATMPGRGTGGAATRTRYSAEDREQVLTAIRDRNLSAAEAGREFAINQHTIASWITADRRTAAS